MNIKDFLIENYIWILIIILITIITIIGFLADKKKNGKKNDSAPMPNQNFANNQPMGNVPPMQYNGQEQLLPNQMNNNMGQGMNVNNFNNQMQPVNQVPNMQNIPNQGNMNGMNQEQPMTTIPTGMEQMTNPSPVENIMPNTPTEPIYQPLSEQTPVISPSPVPNFNDMTNNNQTMPVQPMNNNVNPMNQNSVAPMPQNYNQPVPPAEPMASNPMLNYNVPTPMPQQMDNNFGNVQNYQQNNTTIPEPVNSIPTPQPINPQPIMPGMYNNGQPMPQNYNNQPVAQPNYNQQPSPEQVPQQMPNQPITFVYGPQNNNQNM